MMGGHNQEQSAEMDKLTRVYYVSPDIPTCTTPGWYWSMVDPHPAKPGSFRAFGPFDTEAEARAEAEKRGGP